MKTYEELVSFHSFRERFEYLKLGGGIGTETFGFDRYLNQAFYKSKEWIRARDLVIIRDLGCDLGIPGMEIMHGLTVHHINPIRIEDIEGGVKSIVDPRFLITVSDRTHRAIHFGDERLIPKVIPPRYRNDTIPWR